MVVGAIGEITFNVQNELLGDGKSLVGVIEGDSIPKLFLPKLLDYYKKGMFPMDKLMKFYSSRISMKLRLLQTEESASRLC